MFYWLCLFVLQCMVSSSILCIDQFFDQDFPILRGSYQMEHVRDLTTSRSWLSLVQRVEGGKQFVIKQTRDHIPCHYITAVRTVLASWIAQTVSLSMDHAVLICPHDIVLGKYYASSSASLHTIIPGEVIYKYPRFNTVQIRQSTTGSVVGIRKIISSIAVHHDLACVAAFDTFVGNTDRSNNNLFYDEQSDRVYGLDQELAFDDDLCAHAETRLRQTLRGGRAKIIGAEYSALVVYRNTLAQLITLNPADRIVQMFDQLIVAAQPVPPLLTDKLWLEWNKEIARIRALVIKSGKSAQSLCSFLDQYLSSYLK